MTIALKLDHVRKEFPAKGAEAFVAVENISLDIHQGEFVSIVGPSGCGKSTLLDLVAGMTKPSHGQILLNGKTITGTGIRSWHRVSTVRTISMAECLTKH